MRLKIILTCLVVAWLSGVAPADACSCIGPRPACQGVWLSDAAFVGRVLEVTSLKNDPGQGYVSLRSRRVTLEVVEKFRGDSLLAARDASPTVDVFTGAGGGDCGIAFKKGESYLVFATIIKGESKRLQTGLCDRTRELSRAQEDLPYLRSFVTSPPSSSSPRGGRVYGYVELFDPPSIGRRMGAPPPERKFLADVPITLTEEGGAGVTKKTSTNASGQYEFTDLAPGTYRVEPSLPDIYRVDPPGRRPFVGELRDSRGCSEVNVYVTPDAPV